MHELQLAPADFGSAAGPHAEAAGLHERPLERILAGCARQRAVAIRQRLDNLIPQARCRSLSGRQVFTHAVRLGAGIQIARICIASQGP